MSTVGKIVRTRRRALAAWLIGSVLTASGVALADANATEAETHLASGRFAEAGSAYRRAFAETGEADFLKKAGQAFMQLGAPGKKDAVLSFRLFKNNAKGEKQRDEAKRLLKQAEALPDRAPEAAPPAPPEPPAAPAPEAAPPPPVEAPPPAPVPPPAADELPPAEPIESIGSLRWSPSLGFVQPGEPAPKPGPQKDSASGGLSIPQILDLNLGAVGWTFGAGATTINPINDGVTDDATALTLLEIDTDVRAEFRTMSELLSWWFDLDFAALFGERKQTEPVESGVALGVQSFRLGGRVGLDLHPAPAIAVGPFGGYRADFYQANLTSEDGTALTDNGMETDSGLQYGAHVVLRTKERPGEPATFYFEPMIARRHGQLVGLYAGADLGLRAGGVYFRGWYERRLGADGSFSFARDVGDPDAADGVDAPTLSHAIALAMPVEQRVGGGVTLMF
jgi:hypothetical protein